MELIRSGYSQLKQFDATKELAKEDAEFIRSKKVDVLGWVSSEITEHFKTALYKEIERHKTSLTKCNAEDMRFLQGKVAGLESIIARITTLSNAAKKL